MEIARCYRIIISLLTHTVHCTVVDKKQKIERVDAIIAFGFIWLEVLEEVAA